MNVLPGSAYADGLVSDFQRVAAVNGATAEPTELGRPSPKWFMPVLFGVALVVYGAFACVQFSGWMSTSHNQR